MIGLPELSAAELTQSPCGCKIIFKNAWHSTCRVCHVLHSSVRDVLQSKGLTSHLCVHGGLSLCSSRLAPSMCVNNLDPHSALQELGLAASHRQARYVHTQPAG